MSKKMSILIIMLLIFGAAICVHSQNFIPYQNAQKGFSLQVPNNWQQSSQDFYGQEVVYFLSPLESQQDFFQENISIMIFPLQGPLDLDTLSNMYTQQSQAQIPNLQVVQSQNINLSNVPAKYVLYTGSMQQVNMAFLVVYVITQNQAFIIQCTSDANKYQQYQSTFSQVLGSFTLIQQEQPTPFQQQPFQQQQEPLTQQQPFQEEPPIAQEPQLPLIPEETPQTEGGLPSFDQFETQPTPQTEGGLPQFN